MIKISPAANSLSIKFLALLSLLAFSHPGFSFSVTGNGHYSLEPATQTHPGFSNKLGLYQATRQDFGLMLDLKSNDELNIKIQFDVFADKARDAYLGDSATSEQCSSSSDNGVIAQSSTNDCNNKHPNTSSNSYEPYQPHITELYAEYSTEFCLIRAGRRGRDFGMGVFLDSGRDPFEYSKSVFDGVGCHLVAEQFDNLSFSFGYDKISETGASVTGTQRTDGSVYGANKTSDDIDQIFATIEFNNTKTASKDSFRRHLGVYVANIFGNSKLDTGDEDKLEAKTDIKYADLYTAFYYSGFAFRNEVIFRMGKSADPNWAYYGGRASNVEDGIFKNKLESIALAGEFHLRFAEDGSYNGPEEFLEGDKSSQNFKLGYAYAPGDKDGYRDMEDRDTSVTAFAFHRNYQPTLLLTNQNSVLDQLHVDGNFEAGRVMNTMLYYLEYAYDDLAYGNFGIKLATASLISSMPGDVKQAIKAAEVDAEVNQIQKARRPMGFKGKELGYEVDLLYEKNIGKDFLFGVDAAVAFPGAAWKIFPDSNTQTSYLLQGKVSFKF